GGGVPGGGRLRLAEEGPRLVVSRQQRLDPLPEGRVAGAGRLQVGGTLRRRPLQGGEEEVPGALRRGHGGTPVSRRPLSPHAKAAGELSHAWEDFSSRPSSPSSQRSQARANVQCR